MDAPRESQLRKHRSSAILLGILVLLVSIGLAMRNDLQRADAQFAELGGEIERVLTRRLDNLNASLRSLSGMHHAMTRLSQQELSAFAQEIERSHPYDKAIVQLRQINDTERSLYEHLFRKTFRSIEDLLAVSLEISNRRKSRAGRSLEYHLIYVLQRLKVPHAFNEVTESASLPSNLCIRSGRSNIIPLA